MNFPRRQFLRFSAAALAAGVDPASSTPEELTAIMKAEITLWGPVIKAANIKGE